MPPACRTLMLILSFRALRGSRWHCHPQLQMEEQVQSRGTPTQNHVAEGQVPCQPPPRLSPTHACLPPTLTPLSHTQTLLPDMIPKHGAGSPAWPFLTPHFPESPGHQPQWPTGALSSGRTLHTSRAVPSPRVFHSMLPNELLSMLQNPSMTPDPPVSLPALTPLGLPVTGFLIRVHCLPLPRAWPHPVPSGLHSEPNLSSQDQPLLLPLPT